MSSSANFTVGASASAGGLSSSQPADNSSPASSIAAPLPIPNVSTNGPNNQPTSSPSLYLHPNKFSSGQGSPSTSRTANTQPRDSSPASLDTDSTAAHLSTLGINPNNPNNEFLPFPRLPLELRLKCFHEMFPGPRVIEVLFSKKRESKKYEFLADTPVVLYICHESRNEALPIYQLAFANKYALKPVYFCPELDMIFLRELQSRTWVQVENFLLTVPDKNLAQKMAFVSTCGLVYRHYEPSDNSLGRLICTFTDIREITITTLLNVFRGRDFIQEHERSCKTCAETPHNRTVLLSEEEAIEHGSPIEGLNVSSLITSPRDRVAGFLAQHQRIATDILKGVNSGPAGTQVWGAGVPKIMYKASLYHKINKDSFWAKPMGRKVYATRSRRSIGGE